MQQYVVVPVPHDFQSQRLEKAGALTIAFGVIHMLSAIDFHHQPRFEADEVDEVMAHRILPPELDTGQATIAQGKPKLQLRIGLQLA
jgi:hypothetical protein